MAVNLDSFWRLVLAKGNKSPPDPYAPIVSMFLSD